MHQEPESEYFELIKRFDNQLDEGKRVIITQKDLNDIFETGRTRNLEIWHDDAIYLVGRQEVGRIPLRFKDTCIAIKEQVKRYVKT